MPTATDPSQIDFTGVVRVLFRGVWIKQIWWESMVLWPGGWYDIWDDHF